MRTFFTSIILFALCSWILAVVPAGYYQSAEGKNGAELKTILHQIIANDTTGNLSLGSGAGRTWEAFYSTDRDMTTNAVIDMYSPEIRYFPSPNPDFASFGQDVHIEHSLPRSWWGGSTSVAANTDLHHLFPADGVTNNAKSNHPLGVVTGTLFFDNGVSKVGNGNYPGYTNRVFEPADEYKGDFARAYLYIATAYQNYSGAWNSPMMDNNTYPVFNNWAIHLLLQWHRQDPVSVKETTRNNVVYSFQNNRNPYIDYPQLAEHVWGNMATVPFYINSVPTAARLNAFVSSLSSNVTMTITTNINTPAQRAIHVKCSNLQGAVTLSITGANASLFSISKSSLTQSAATNGEDIVVTYSPNITGTHSAVLTISSPNASAFVINLSGLSR